MSEKKKVFDCYVVEEGKKEDESFWNKVGVAFENRDGSLSVKLHMFPELSIQVRERRPREDRERGQGERRDQRGRR